MDEANEIPVVEYADRSRGDPGVLYNLLVVTIVAFTKTGCRCFVWSSILDHVSLALRPEHADSNLVNDSYHRSWQLVIPIARRLGRNVGRNPILPVFAGKPVLTLRLVSPSERATAMILPWSSTEAPFSRRSVRNRDPGPLEPVQLATVSRQAMRHQQCTDVRNTCGR